MRLEKWQALGNDYVIIEEAALPWPLTPERIRAVCDPHFGVGADGILLLSEDPDPDLVARLRIFNPDGSEAELSGNGAREAVMYLRRRGHAEADEFAIITEAGVMRPRITGPTTCSMHLGQVRTTSSDFPSGPPDGRGELATDGATFAFQHVSVGNPQCAIHVTDLGQLEQLPLAQLGPGIETNALFPNRTNVSWWAELGPGLIRARIFERGVGETLSSGTGATGAAVAYHLSGGPTRVTVRLDGGELDVEIAENLDITLSGWAVPVYSAQLSDEFLRSLETA
jgi:diaminopimelate epimerase